MTTEICKRLNIRLPIFAFSHCRDVVVAVSKAGGIGVYGAALHSSQQVETDIKWIESQLGGLPYGMDLMLPNNYVSVDETELMALIPPQHREFLDDMMDRYHVPKLSGETDDVAGLLGEARFTPEQNAAILDLVFSYSPKIFVSALGTPAPEVIARAHSKGMLVGALAGMVKHALRHVKAGVDFVVAASNEAGGHTGEIGSMVLIPEVVDAVAPIPVLAAGGIGRGRQIAASIALGAQGVWCGSVWLTSAESDVLPLLKEKLLAAGSDDTVRTKCFTGKYARFLKTAWSDEWDEEGAPKPLPTPLQTVLIGDYVRRIAASAASGKVRLDAGAGKLISTPVGQIVGAMKTSTSSREIIHQMLDEFAEATTRLNSLFEET